jgi:hypothetical protein
MSEDILIDGSNFISPDQVPAPEENIPGQVLESLSIKVFNNVFDGTAPLETSIKISDGLTKKFKINIKLIENKSIIIYVDKIKKELNIDYQILWDENSVEFFNELPQGSIIEITAFGIGGVGILDIQEFVADGETNLFLTNANYNETTNVYVTVNGEFVDVSFINSSDILDIENRSSFFFIIPPNLIYVLKRKMIYSIRILVPT